MRRVRSRIQGVRERLAYGQLEVADVPCQDGLVCLEVEEDRRECRPVNLNGN